MKPAISITTNFFMLLLSLLAAGNLTAQDNSVATTQWVEMLGTKSGPVNSGINELFIVLKSKDSAAAAGILNEIEKEANPESNYFRARFDAIKSRWLRSILPFTDSNNNRVSYFLTAALNAAYETNNDSLVSEMAWAYGITCYQISKIEPAATYCLFAAELDNKIGKRSEADKCWYLGIILFITRDYQKSIQYTKAALQRETDTSKEGKRVTLGRYNTVALCYQRMAKYDSAFFHYSIAMNMAENSKDTVWKAILSGNIGQIYYLQGKYALAKPLLYFDYAISKVNEEESSAGNTLQWIARINLAEGKLDSALSQVKEALYLVEQKQDQSTQYYRQNIYAAATEVYRALGNTDSTLKYAALYSHLHDSLERAIADSRVEISLIKLDNIQNVLAVKNLLKEKEAVAKQRNLIVLLILLLGTIALLLYNRQQQQIKHRQKMMLQEKRIAESKVEMAEAERRAANEQLEMFTQNVIEKSQLIEKLEQQLQTNLSDSGQEDIIRELTQQTILTEADWSKFKSLFETIYPGFFSKLKQKSGDITLAELRMSALIRLQLQPKQMAALLGISLNSVYKAKQRLRLRFKQGSDEEVETFIRSI
jgi:DNA-binding CsgD family transcriptional regulator